jgi:hypothetical protein
MDALLGITFGDWCRLLRENRFAVDPGCYNKALVLTLASLMNTAGRWHEERLYRERIAEVERIPAPLFIIGHWRTGTTLLHNLLRLDERFAYPTLFQVSNPHTFLSREEKAAERWANAPRVKRPMDNMKVRFDSPGEDEFAIATLSLRSPIIGWAFPRRARHYDQYLTFDDAPEADVARWQDALRAFLRKLTWKYDRPLLLKSPAHTGRIRLLLRIFPGARFIHLHRDPYTVFQSTQRLYEYAVTPSHLQQTDQEEAEGSILRRYAAMYDAFFRDRALIPNGRLCDVCFEELEDDKVGQVRRIYEQLNLPGFRDLEPQLERYVESISDYQKTRHPPLSESERQKIRDWWQQSFEMWAYNT